MCRTHFTLKVGLFRQYWWVLKLIALSFYPFSHHGNIMKASGSHGMIQKNITGGWDEWAEIYRGTKKTNQSINNKCYLCINIEQTDVIRWYFAFIFDHLKIFFLLNLIRHTICATTVFFLLVLFLVLFRNHYI